MLIDTNEEQQRQGNLSLLFYIRSLGKKPDYITEYLINTAKRQQVAKIKMHIATLKQSSCAVTYH